MVFHGISGDMSDLYGKTIGTPWDNAGFSWDFPWDLPSGDLLHSYGKSPF